MSIDKSLKKKGSLVLSRNVLRRAERIEKLKENERWTDETSPYGLPKVRVYRLVAKKAKKVKKEEGTIRRSLRPRRQTEEVIAQRDSSIVSSYFST